MATASASLDVLLNELLEHTLQLQNLLLQDVEPEEWNEVLDRRQRVIEQLNELFAVGVTLSEDQRNTYLLPTANLDKGFVPMMNRKKMKLTAEMANFQKSKVVNEQYGGYGSSPTAYGAFFDKRN